MGTQAIYQQLSRHRLSCQLNKGIGVPTRIITGATYKCDLDQQEWVDSKLGL